MSYRATDAAPPSVELEDVAQLVEPGDVETLTWVRMSTPRDALARGLAEYLGNISIDWNGRELRFEEVHNVWAVPEDVATLPALAIISPTPAEYEANVMVGEARVVCVGGQERELKIASEVTQDFAIVVWAATPDERTGFVAAIEDAFEASELHSGLRLRLPYYHDTFAEYEKLTVLYDDDSRSAQARRRRAIIVATGRCTQYVRVGARPRMRVKARVIITDGPFVSEEED